LLEENGIPPPEIVNCVLKYRHTLTIVSDFDETGEIEEYCVCNQCKIIFWTLKKEGTNK
jgi:hypothetical protein